LVVSHCASVVHNRGQLAAAMQLLPMGERSQHNWPVDMSQSWSLFQSFSHVLEQMPVPELVGRKRPPVDELRGEIVSPVRQHDGPAREQDVAKHAEGQPQQEGNSDPTGTD